MRSSRATSPAVRFCSRASARSTITAFTIRTTGAFSRAIALTVLYHSVNPVALKSKSDVLATNERHITILDTKNFGKLAYVEVGAMCVGRIVLTHTEGEFLRGDEKGYFLFGGSTVVVLGQRGVWQPDAELLEQTSRKRETLVRLG